MCSTGGDGGEGERCPALGYGHPSPWAEIARTWQVSLMSSAELPWMAGQEKS